MQECRLDLIEADIPVAFVLWGFFTTLKVSKNGCQLSGRFIFVCGTPSHIQLDNVVFIELLPDRQLAIKDRIQSHPLPILRDPSSKRAPYKGYSRKDTPFMVTINRRRVLIGLENAGFNT